MKLVKIKDWIRLSYLFFTHEETVAYFVDDISKPENLVEFRANLDRHFRRYTKFIEEIYYYQLKKYFDLDKNYEND